MNYPFVFRQLSAVCALLGGFMLFSIPWALPVFGGNWNFEQGGVIGLVLSIIVCTAISFLFRFLSRVSKKDDFFSKREAIAVVGLTWILATFLGSLPYLLAAVHRNHETLMSVSDALFESQSGFSTTGATVFGELERPELLPRCILFWRCSTHFLGGLGIMVLFVVLLGYGTGSGASMKGIIRSEMTGPAKANPRDRVRQLAKIVFVLYVGLNLIQTLLLVVQGLTVYDALCHSFSTVSTGGFSTFNASAGHFAAHGYLWARSIEWTLVLFMFLGGTNFMLLWFLVLRRPGVLFRNTEWRAYVGIIAIASLVVFWVGLSKKDFDNYGTADMPFYSQVGLDSPDSEISTLQGRDISETTHKQGLPPRESLPIGESIRVVVFQVVSILTTTGLCTDEYEKWSGLSCCVILLLMFLGGCAGSTSGGFKIIRVVCVLKSLPQEIELAYRPNVVRPLLIGGEPVEKETVRTIMVHFTMLTTIFIIGTIFILCFEPATTWGNHEVTGDRKLIDTASAVASCLNNVGPGLGLIGARQNFGVFSETSKFVFTWLMLLGRLELFVILAMFHPGFWRK